MLFEPLAEAGAEGTLIEEPDGVAMRQSEEMEQPWMN